MFRKRMSKKKNVYKQLISPFDKYLPTLFMLTNQKIVETKPRVVTFKIGGWKDKWPQAIIWNNYSILVNGKRYNTPAGRASAVVIFCIFARVVLLIKNKKRFIAVVYAA